jgi:anti-sigma-K factor RskA
MDPTEHDLLQDQDAPYVLGTLAAEERAAFEGHLATCLECRARVESVARAFEAVGRGIPQIDPPPALRDRVLRSVAGGAPEPSRVPAAGARGIPRAAPRWLALAASLALAVGLGVYAVALRARVGALEADLRQATLRAEATESRLAEASRSAATAQSSVAVLTAPDLARVDLAGQPSAPRASARAYWSRSHGLVFTAANLPALPAGRTYQLWVVTAQVPISAGLMKPDSNGSVSIVFNTPADLPTPVAMALTIEPDGGVPAPTGDKYLVGAVTGA